MHSHYRKAKKFKLKYDEGTWDNEFKDGEYYVADEFTGTAKNPLKRWKWGSRDTSLWNKVSNPQGYLQSRLGNLWDDVWSEVCRVAKHNKPHVERFIRERIQNNVELNPRVVDGELYTAYNYWSSKLAAGQFYVLDGVLCRMPAEPRYVRSVNNWEYRYDKPRHYDKKTLMVGDIMYWQDKQTYNQRVAPGVFETVDTFVWYKDIPYQYTSTAKNWERRGEEFFPVFTVHTETHYKVVAVSKKAIKKYKLNEIS